MEKVYIVFHMYHEHSKDPVDTYNTETIENVFKSEDKAIDYIYDRIRESHKWADEYWPNDELVIKYEPDMNMIRENWVVDSWERDSDELYVTNSFRYVSYSVE